MIIFKVILFSMRISDQILLSTALCLSAIGIFLLSLLYWQYEPELHEIDEASSTDQTIRLRGTISHLQSYPGREQFVLVSECTLPVTIFENRELQEGQVIEIEGMSSEYNGKDQFTAETITIIK